MKFFGGGTLDLHRQPIVKRCVVEAVGTFFLFLAVALTSNPWTIGFMVMAMIYVGGHVSGAHLNPALSLAAYLRNALSSNDLFAYIGAQTAGALIGAALFWSLSGFPLVLQIFDQVLIGFTYETLMTFVFCSVFLAMSFHVGYKDKALTGLIIGLTLLGLSFFPVTINPAVALGALVAGMMSGVLENVLPALAHAVFPFAGSVLAAYFYKYLND